MSTTYSSKKRVTSAMAGTTHTLPILVSKLRVSLEYVWSKLRVSLEAGYNDITARPQRHYGSLPTTLRLVTFLLLLMSVGVNGAWGQGTEEPDYSGYYYIANYKTLESSSTYYSKDTPANNFYLCPAQYYYHSEETGANVASTTPNDTPFLTTNKTNHDNNSLWIIEKVNNENLYYIKHKGVGPAPDKYIVKNESLKGKATGADTDARLRVHLEQIEDIENSDKKDDAKFEITKYGSDDNIYYAIKINSIKSAWLNPSKGNKPDYVPSESEGIGGIIGYYTEAPNTDKGKGSRWCFEKLKCKAVVITYDNTQKKVTITSETDGANIYYTLNNSDPSSGSTLYGAPFEVTDNTTIKAIATKSGYADSEIASVKVVLNPTITLAQTGYTYSGSAIEPSVSSVQDGETTIDAEEYAVTYSDNINVGTATVNIEDNAGGEYIVYGSTTFTINPAGVTLTANSGTEAYDGTEKTVSGFTSSINGLTFEGVSASGSGTNIGNYPVTFTGVTIGTTKDTSGNYVVTSTINGTLTISPKSLTITADSDTKVYDGTPLTKNSYTNTELIAGDLIESVTVTGSQTDAGTSNNVPGAAVIKNSANANVTANYEITYANGSLEVTKKPLTLTADANSKAYGEADPTLTYTSEGLINDDVITGTLSREPGENVGTYAITQGNLTAGNNYEITFTGANLTITKAGLTITANNHTITYGDAPASNGVTYSGFVYSETESVLGGTLDYDFSYMQYVDVGDYTITPKGLTSGNYEITFAEGTLTVNPKVVGITWENTTFTFDGEEHAPTATATGLVNSDEIGVTVTGTQTNAGNYTATASALTGSKKDNYQLPDANTQSFTISCKSIGNGSLAEGFTLEFDEDGDVIIKYGTYTLTADDDYTTVESQEPGSRYSTKTISGEGNFTGSLAIRNAIVHFNTDANHVEWSATFVAESSGDTDIGHVLPDGISAYIISAINGNRAIPEQLNYIPAGVPVLLVAHEEKNGFLVTDANSESVTEITDAQKEYNKLKKVTTESAHFNTRQIYVLYNNEFVLNKAGDLAQGKVYMENPNYDGNSPAPASLIIDWGHVTDIIDIEKNDAMGRTNDRWYTIDGRRLNGTPTTKGLYIVNGKKIVVK